MGHQRPPCGPWGLIGGRYFPVTCPCKSQLHLILDGSSSHFRVVLSEPPPRWTPPTLSLSRGSETPPRRGHICPIYPDTGMELSATIPGQARLASADPASLDNMLGLLPRAFPILPSSSLVSLACRIPHHLSAPPPGSRIPLLHMAGPVTEVLAFSAWPHSDRCLTQDAHTQQKRSATVILVRPACRGLSIWPQGITIGAIAFMGLEGWSPRVRYPLHHSGS